MPEKMMKCYVCGADVPAGEACPRCEWDDEKEILKAKGEKRRQEIKDQLEKEGKEPKTPKRKNIWGS